MFSINVDEVLDLGVSSQLDDFADLINGMVDGFIDQALGVS